MKSFRIGAALLLITPHVSMLLVKTLVYLKKITPEIWFVRGMTEVVLVVILSTETKTCAIVNLIVLIEIMITRAEQLTILPLVAQTMTVKESLAINLYFIYVQQHKN